LSDRIRSVLSKFVEELKLQEAVSSVGLFGSWSRGDAVPESDVDLLIVDKRDFDYEYVERLEFDDLLLDLNYIPEKWLIGRVPPEIDQKIYEVDILYDRDQRLTRTKRLMQKTHWTHERVDLRTESYLIDAYTYLSRATSAQNKGDFRSAKIYATMGVEEILKTLIEVNMLPVSNSHFIEALESSAKELGLREVFDNYLAVSELSELDRLEVENQLSHIESVWNEAITGMQSLSSALETLHIKIKKNLNYYVKSAFLKGLIARSKAIISEDLVIEAGHYVNKTFIDMLENYAWLVLATKKSRFDYTTLFDSLRSVDSSKTIYEGAVEAFRLEDAASSEAEESLKNAKEMIHDIRQRRKELISRYVKPPA